MAKYSKISAQLSGQPMFQILERAKALQAQGKEILRFEMGESSYPAYDVAVEKTVESLRQGHTHYVSAQGTLSLRKTICEYTFKTHGFRPHPDQVLVMPANAVIDTIVRCTCDPGDSVIIPDPGFSTYHSVLKYLSLKKIPLKLDPDHQFKIDFASLDQESSTNASLMISNSPNNPTGKMLQFEESQKLFELAEEQDLFLLSDEVYSTLVYEGTHHSPCRFDECKERTLLLQSFSKGFNMAGWRIGYVIGPIPLIEKMKLLFETLYSCVPHFIQAAAESILKEDAWIAKAEREKLKLLRNTMMQHMAKVPGFQFAQPKASPYLFVNMTRLGVSANSLADYLLEEAGVTVLPGDLFGEQGKGFIRLCFARPELEIVKACDRINRAIRKGIESGIFPNQNSLGDEIELFA